MVWVAYMVGMGRDSGGGGKGEGERSMVWIVCMDSINGERVEEGGGIGKGLRVIVGALYTTWQPVQVVFL